MLTRRASLLPIRHQLGQDHAPAPQAVRSLAGGLPCSCACMPTGRPAQHRLQAQLGRLLPSRHCAAHTRLRSHARVPCWRCADHPRPVWRGGQPGRGGRQAGAAAGGGCRCCLEAARCARPEEAGAAAAEALLLSHKCLTFCMNPTCAPGRTRSAWSRRCSGTSRPQRWVPAPAPAAAGCCRWLLLPLPPLPLAAAAGCRCHCCHCRRCRWLLPALLALPVPCPRPLPAYPLIPRPPAVHHRHDPDRAGCERVGPAGARAAPRGHPLPPHRGEPDHRAGHGRQVSGCWGRGVSGRWTRSSGRAWAPSERVPGMGWRLAGWRVGGGWHPRLGAPQDRAQPRP